MNNFVMDLSCSELPIRFFSGSNYFEDYKTVERNPSLMNFNQILFVLGGSGRLLCQGREYTLSRGNAFYIAKGVGYSQFSDDGLITAFLTAKGKGMDGIRKRYSADGFMLVEATDIDKWVSVITRIIKEYESEATDGRMSSLVYSFFNDFFENAEKLSVSPMERIYKYIDYHLGEKLTLESLARIGDISVSKLCHDFKRCYGKTVMGHIIDKRLDWARVYILANPSALTKEVARLSGFDDASYFCRAYKKKYGHSPSRSRID
ncbi:MAG: helix-turn-helix transcriptional regulator [Clostridia bacterium]|nr:helix-turn-helix transcriptional regulator [Clostridia bacterium]